MLTGGDANVWERVGAVVTLLFRVQLSSLPAEIGQLQKLRVLFAYRNRLTEVPEELGACTKLEVPIQEVSGPRRTRSDATFCPSGAEFGQQPAVHAAGIVLQPDPAEEAEPEPQPHRSRPRLCLQHESSGRCISSIGSAHPTTSRLPSRCSCTWPATAWTTWLRTSRL